MFEKGQFSLTGSKKAFAETELTRAKMDESFPTIKNTLTSSYFVEMQHDLHTNT
jgi:hypothetical protein